MASSIPCVTREGGETFFIRDFFSRYLLKYGRHCVHLGFIGIVIIFCGNCENKRLLNFRLMTSRGNFHILISFEFSLGDVHAEKCFLNLLDTDCETKLSGSASPVGEH